MNQATTIVSVICITYNQEGYIRQALEGFVMQKTNFNFEVIVADDCSQDKTPAIIKEYAERYPDIFKPILRNKNTGAQNNFIDALRQAKGEYIAICEGDDYWTDSKKLQTQVDFLEKNADYALCFHPVKVFFENKEEKSYIYPKSNSREDFTVENLLRGNFVQTNSVMYRRQDYRNLNAEITPFDWYLHLYHAWFGKIGFVDKVMSNYRRHQYGMWWSSYKNRDKFWTEHGIAHIAFCFELLKLYSANQKYQNIIYEFMAEILSNIVLVDTKLDNATLQKILNAYPKKADIFIIAQHYKLEAKTNLLKEKNNYISDMVKTMKLKDDHIKNLEAELQMIKSGRIWRTKEKIKSLKRSN